VLKGTMLILSSVFSLFFSKDTPLVWTANSRHLLDAIIWTLHICFIHIIFCITWG